MSVLKRNREIAYTEFERQMCNICKELKARLSTLPVRYHKYLDRKIYEPASRAFEAVIIANEKNAYNDRERQKRDALFHAALADIGKLQKPLLAYWNIKDSKEGGMMQIADMIGREYGLIEKYMMDDAEEAIVLIGSSAGTAKAAIQELRAQGKKVGLIKIRSFRPFPAEDIAEALKNVKSFAVMDKDDSFNAHCGPIFAETAAALYANGVTAPKGINYIYGLGGRDVRVESIKTVFAELEKISATGETGDTYRYLDVRE